MRHSEISLHDHDGQLWYDPPSRASDPSEIVVKTELLCRLHARIDALPTDEAYIVRKRYGLDGHAQTLRELGQRFQVTPQYIEKRVRKLRDKLRIGLWDGE